MIAAAFLLLASPLVAVMPPDDNLAKDMRAIDAQSIMRAEVARMGRVRSVDATTLKRLIASAADSGIKCNAGLADCAARIGAFGALDFVVVTRLEPGASAAPATSVRATLALHDCADGREVRTTSGLLGADDAARTKGLAALARAVLGEGDLRGQLEVTGPREGIVVVDGVERGAAPLSLAVNAGVHDVSWRSPSGATSSVTIEVPVAAVATAAFPHGAQAGSGELSQGVSRFVGAQDASWTSSPLALAAGGGLAFGAVVAVGGAVGAWAVAPAADARQRYSATGYNDAVALGRALLGVSIAGVVLAAVGGGGLVLASAGDGAPE